MTPAANERRLAGKWIVWWWHESHAIVDGNGNVTGHEYRKLWRHDRIRRKLHNGILSTYGYIRLYQSDNVFIVDGEIAGWPRFTNPDGGQGARRALTDSEFSELTRCQP